MDGHLTYMLAGLFDDPRVQKLMFALGFLVVASIVCGVVFVVVRLRQGKQLDQAKGHLKGGRLDKAAELFIKLIRRSSTRDMHRQAMDGLSRVYRKADIDVDLRPIDKLKARIKAVQKNPENQARKVGLTPEGMAQLEKVSNRFEEFMDRLPIPDAGTRRAGRSGGSRGRSRSKQSNPMPWVYAGGGVVAVILLGVVAVAFLGDGDDGGPGGNQPDPAAIREQAEQRRDEQRAKSDALIQEARQQAAAARVNASDPNSVVGGNAAGSGGAYRNAATLTAPPENISRGGSISPDGSTVAGISSENVFVWRLDKPQIVITCKTDGPQVVSFSSDGNRALFYSQIMTEAWDLTTGQRLAEYNGSGLSSAAISSDGSLAAKGGFNGKIEVWETATGQLRTTLEKHATAVRGIAMPDNERLVSSDGKDIRWWTLSDGQAVSTPMNSAGNWRSAIFTSDGKRGVFSDRETVEVWNLTEPKRTGSLTPGITLYTLSLSADGNYLATTASGQPRLWDVRAEPVEVDLGGVERSVHVAPMRDGGLITLSSRTGPIIWKP